MQPQRGAERDGGDAAVAPRGLLGLPDLAPDMLDQPVAQRAQLSEIRIARNLGENLPPQFAPPLARQARFGGGHDRLRRLRGRLAEERIQIGRRLRCRPLLVQRDRPAQQRRLLRRQLRQRLFAPEPLHRVERIRLVVRLRIQRAAQRDEIAVVNRMPPALRLFAEDRLHESDLDFLPQQVREEARHGRVRLLAQRRDIARQPPQVRPGRAIRPAVQQQHPPLRVELHAVADDQRVGHFAQPRLVSRRAVSSRASRRPRPRCGCAAPPNPAP